MDVFAQFAADEQKETDGVWKSIGDGAKLLIARNGNRKHARMLSRLVEQNQRALDAKNDASDDLSDSIMIDVMANTILLNWEGIKFKGEDLPYSIDNAKKLLAVRDFRVLVTNLSSDFSNYRVAADEDARKNLETA